MKTGFEARNSPILLNEDWEKIDALDSTIIKLRSYHCIPENISRVVDRNLSVILRPSSDGEMNAADRYFELGEAITKLLDAGVPEILLLPDSEPNLHGRPMPPDYWNQIATFFLLVDKQFGEHNRSSRLKYGTPPMALAQGEEAWLAAATVTRMQGMHEGETENFLTGFDFYTLHAYGQLDESLVDHAIALARKYAPGLPIVAAEVGDSSNANPSTKAEAIVRYLQKLERTGAYAACLFIVGSHDPQWSGFVLPVDQIRHIAAIQPETPVQPIPAPGESTLPESPLNIPTALIAAAIAFAPGASPSEATVRDWTRDEIIARIIAYSDAAGVPRRLSLACGIAESNLRQYATREGKWPDVSYGIGQQIVLYAPVGNGQDTPENRAVVKQWLYDPENAIPLMVGKLAANYDNRIKAGYSEADAQMLALAKYNSGQWTIPSDYSANYDNYRRGFIQADAILATWSEPVTPEAKATIATSLHKLWALASAFEQNADQPNADYIKAEVARIKEAIGIQP